MSTLTISPDQHSEISEPTTKLRSSPQSVPLYIPLGDRLTDAAEVACAEAVARWLSYQCDRVVALSELEGLLLYLWSEDDVEGRSLEDYRNGDRPLQAILLQARGLSGDRIASAELLPFVGRRLEFRVSGLSC